MIEGHLLKSERLKVVLLRRGMGKREIQEIIDEYFGDIKKETWAAAQGNPYAKVLNEAFYKDQLKQAERKIEEIINDAESDYEWGGDEDKNGTLMPGTVDFKEMREKIVAVIKQMEG